MAKEGKKVHPVPTPDWDKDWKKYDPSQKIDQMTTMIFVT